MRTLNYELEEDATLTIQLIDITNGNIVLNIENNIAQMEGMHTKSLNLSGINSGVYKLLLYAEGELVSKSVLKL